MSDAPPPYAELYCRSNRTFLLGASEPEELVGRAAAKLYAAIALTDECSVSGVVRAHLAALPGCIALLLPDPDETVETLFAKAMWLKTWFDGRAWLLEPRPMNNDDELRCWIIEQVADLTTLRIVATASP